MVHPKNPDPSRDSTEIDGFDGLNAIPIGLDRVVIPYI